MGATRCQVGQVDDCSAWASARWRQAAPTSPAAMSATTTARAQVVAVLDDPFPERGLSPLRSLWRLFPSSFLVIHCLLEPIAMPTFAEALLSM
jgi:hypothetical protein